MRWKTGWLRVSFWLNIVAILFNGTLFVLDVNRALAVGCVLVNTFIACWLYFTCREQTGRGNQ